ncbi:MAG: YfhO family protein [Bryobacteraceae bacterium]
MEVDAKRAGVLVLSQRFSKGWSAAVDGGTAPLMRADGELQALALPSGNHQVVVKFRPWQFYLGALFSLAGLLAPLVLKSWRRLSSLLSRDSELLMSPRHSAWPRENDPTQRWDRRSSFVVCQAVTPWRGPDRPRKTLVCPTASPPNPGSTQIPRHQEFGISAQQA